MERRSYLLKERVSDLDELVRVLQEVARRGSALDPKVVEGLLTRTTRAGSSALASLNDRQLEVLREVASGRSNVALSVFERTRELGLLRAVGLTRNQVRAMVRWESAVISLIGAVSGAVLDTGIALALSQVLKDQGVVSVSVPVTQIAVYVAVAAAAGILAGVGPARSAAKVDVLKALVTD